MYAEKIFPTQLHHHQLPKALKQGRKDTWIHAVNVKAWTGNFSTVLLSNCNCGLDYFFLLLSWLEKNPMFSSAAVAHPLQGLMWCAFRDVLLHVTVQLWGYFSYCRLPVSLNQSGRSSVTSLITLTSLFHPQNCHSLLFVVVVFPVLLWTLEAVVHDNPTM